MPNVTIATNPRLAILRYLRITVTNYLHGQQSRGNRNYSHDITQQAIHR